MCVSHVQSIGKTRGGARGPHVSVPHLNNTEIRY